MEYMRIPQSCAAYVPVPQDCPSTRNTAIGPQVGSSRRTVARAPMRGILSDKKKSRVRIAARIIERTTFLLGWACFCKSGVK